MIGATGSRVRARKEENRRGVHVRNEGRARKEEENRGGILIRESLRSACAAALTCLGNEEEQHHPHDGRPDDHDVENPSPRSVVGNET